MSVFLHDHTKEEGCHAGCPAAQKLTLPPRGQSVSSPKLAALQGENSATRDEKKLTHKIAIAPWGWGKAETIEGARKKCMENAPRGTISRGRRSKIVFFDAHADTTCTGLGDFEFPRGFQPRRSPENYGALIANEEAKIVG